jgi:hypothetical protein
MVPSVAGKVIKIAQTAVNSLTTVVNGINNPLPSQALCGSVKAVLLKHRNKRKLWYRNLH